MSGVWGGWMKRLRRGQAAEDAPSPPPAEMTAQEDTADPDSHAHVALEPVSEGAEADEEVAAEPKFRVAAEPHTEPADAPASERVAEADHADGTSFEQEGPAPGGVALDPDFALFAAAIAEGESVLRTLGMVADEATRPTLVLAPALRSRQLLVVFGQDDGGFCIPPPGAGQPPHILYMRDESRSLAMLGVQPLGADYDACLLGILRIAGALGAKDVFCVGVGAACYSALRFGLDLGAAGVLAAGTLDDVRRGVHAPGLRPGQQSRRLMRLTAELGADMAQAYAAAATRPGLVLCRPGPMALAGLATLPKASIIEAPLADAGDLFAWAGREQLWPGLLRDLLRCRPVSG